MASEQLRTIFVAIADPSISAQPALDRGAQLAESFGARVVLFHAAFDAALSGRPFFDSKRLARSRGSYVAHRTRLLERRAAALRGRGLRVDVSVVWEEPVHEAVIRAAIREKAEFVVAGRHERRANRPPQFRLTDWELMRLCPCPLLLVHPASSRRSSDVVLAALDPMHANEKPAGLDSAITRWAAAIAEALSVDCHTVHAVPTSAYPLGATAIERKRFDSRIRARIQRLMRKADMDVQELHLVHGNVAEVVPDLARELPAQIVVMGIISRRWMKRFVIGDTAETIVRDVSCDLLLIKPEGFRLRLGRTRKEAILLPSADDRL